MMKKRGFTTLEFVVVLVVMLIVSVFVAIALNPYRAVKLDAAAQKVKTDLLYTRNLALSTAKWCGVSFEVDPVNIYTVFETDGVTDKEIENPSQFGTDFVVDLYDYYSGVKINSVNIGGGNKVEFHPLGDPYDDRLGSALTVTGAITLEYSGLTKTILITPNTGRTSIQ